MLGRTAQQFWNCLFSLKATSNVVHPKCPNFQFSFTWSSRRSEIRYRLPTGKKSFEWDSTGFSGVMPVFEEFSFHLEICRSKMFWENQKSSKHGSFLQLCLWLRSRSSGSLGNLVNIWFCQKWTADVVKYFDHRSNLGKYLHILDFRFDSKLIEENSHRRLLSQTKSLSNVGHL